jgi:hypothetical protein
MMSERSIWADSVDQRSRVHSRWDAQNRLDTVGASLGNVETFIYDV